MTPTEEFKHAIENGLFILEQERKGLVRTAAFQPLRQQTHLAARRGLRKQAATLTAVDVDVLEDLLGLLKKLGKGTANDKEDFETRLGLALRLLDKLKPAPDSAEMPRRGTRVRGDPAAAERSGPGRHCVNDQEGELAPR